MQRSTADQQPISADQTNGGTEVTAPIPDPADAPDADQPPTTASAAASSAMPGLAPITSTQGASSLMPPG